MNHVLVTGGAGYVGAVLVPKLLLFGYRVRVLDTFWFGKDCLKQIENHPNLELMEGDIRDSATLEKACKGIDSVIHLAAISNDPSCDLDPDFTKEVNLDAVIQLVKIAKANKIQRFINASSSSVYGIKEEENVTEDLPLDPITYYAKYKAETEKIIKHASSDDFVTVSVRPATVCGYSPRMRLDLSVNIMTNLAMNNGLMTVFGGEQKRPNIHIQDVTDLYILLLETDPVKINGDVFNANCMNMKMIDIAETVRRVLDSNVEIQITPSDDNRSYFTSSEKLIRTLNWQYRFSVEDAIRDMKRAFSTGLIPDPIQNPNYYNVKWMTQKGFR